MDVKLIVVGGKDPGRAIPVRGPKFLIGRSDECQLRPGSDLISRQHCVILLAEGYVAIRDFGSRNGTYVNDQRIEGERELKTGDRVKVGPLEFEVQLSVSVSGKKKPKVNSVQEAAARSAETTSPRDKELDISEWLLDDSTAVLSGDPTHDTVNTTTLSINASDTPTNDTIKARANPAKPAIDPLANPDFSQKNTATSSRAAAADMLKQLLNRRK